MHLILFDLDNTLYAPERELFSLIDVRINRYMHEVVGIPEPDVDGLRRLYWQRYGVTLQGLIRHYGVDPEDYLHYVHDVDVPSRIQPDPELSQALARLPHRKLVFTNGSSDHAERVLGALGIRDHFEGIFDIRVARYSPKPFAEPYHRVLELLGILAEGCVMVEDTLDNLRTAKDLGMKTVLVGPARQEPFVDACIHCASHIGEALGVLGALA